MKECDNSKIHRSHNFILSICLLIMFDTLLLRPSLHCNTPLHFTTLHPTTLHHTSPNYASLIDTSLPLIFTSLPSHLALPIYISYRSISPRITKLLSIKCVFSFSLQLLCKPFLILRRTERDIIINFQRLPVKYTLLLSEFNKV